MSNRETPDHRARSTGDPEPDGASLDEEVGEGDADVVPLQKWLHWAGVGSKHEVRLAVTEGRVTVDGFVERWFGAPIRFGQEVTLDGVRVAAGGGAVVRLMHKPRRHVTQVEDASPDLPGLGRYLQPDGPPLFPVGRLDVNTEGALLWTNDGVLARRLLDPVWGVAKRYRVKIRGHLAIDDPGFDRMRAGMTVGGTTFLPVEVRWEALRTRATWVELVLREGKFREIRRMCAACGYQIVKLRREAVGPIELGALNPRCVRALTDAELAALYGAVDLEVRGAVEIGGASSL